MVSFQSFHLKVEATWGEQRAFHLKVEATWREQRTTWREQRTKWKAGAIATNFHPVEA